MADFPASLAPHHISKIEDQFNTTIVKFENKNEQRFANDHVGEVHYEFKWNKINATYLSSLRSFFQNQLGQYGAWTFNDSRLGGTDITLRFTADKLPVKPLKFNYFDVKIGVKVC